MSETILLKIKNDTDPNKTAGAITNMINENKRVELQAVGAGAVNQALKASIIARTFVASQGVNLYIIPAFANIEIDGENRTAIKLIIKEEF